MSARSMGRRGRSATAAVTLAAFVAGTLAPIGTAYAEATRATPAAGAAPEAEPREALPEVTASASKAAAAEVEMGVARAGGGATATASAAAAPALGAPRAGVSPKAISVPKGEGSISGMGESASMQLSTGAATYSVPIVVPPARGAVQPRLALAYSSTSGAGAAGLGWDLPVAYIARQTDRGPPKYNDAPNGAFTADQDRFVFGGGQELVPLCVVADGACPAVPDETMPAWANGWMYFRPRVEGAYQRFFWSRDRRTWRLQDNRGASLELGVPLDGTGDTNALETDPSSSTRIFRWNIAREYDAHGGIAQSAAAAASPTPVNPLVYRYETVDGTAYLTDVFDTPPAAAPTTSPRSAWAHHVRVAYEARPDTAVSYRRGYRASLTRRIARVDVTSKGASVTSPRASVRRYHLSYTNDQGASLLARVQVEGRCAAPINEAANDALPDASDCPRLPPMAFGYSSPADAGGPTRSVPGMGVFSETLHAVSGSPGRALSEADIDLFDVNADGLVDVLRTSPSATAPEHAVFFNGAGGESAKLSVAVPLGMGTGAPIGSDRLSFAHPNVVALDVDSDARLDLLYMPWGGASRVYTPAPTAGGWKWLSRPMPTPMDRGSLLDLAGRRPQMRVLDANGDGVIDIVVSQAQKMKTFFGLGRYPGGDGRFGSAVWTSGTTAALSGEPVDGCVPGDDVALQLQQPGVYAADLNGDGLVDLARYRGVGLLEYWPGRGDGTWGAVPAPGCGPRPPGTQGAVRMINAPSFAPTTLDFLHFADVNQDGLDDVVHVKGQTVDVYLNTDGGSFAAPPLHILLSDMPFVTTDVVRITDIDGSGTADIVFGHKDAYVYVDLLGGVRPRLLTSVANGLGKTTRLQYASSTAMMLEAERAGKAWATTMPIVTTVVRRVTTSDNLPVAGRPASALVTEYTYRDPVFDGRQREFRGFHETLVREVGDTGSPASSTRTVFLTGDCVDETPGDAVADCEPPGRWRDNGREALKGLPVVLEVFDDNGAYLSTVHRGYTLRHLATGLDGRVVRAAFESATDTWAYDTSPFVPAVEQVEVTDVRVDGASGLPSTRTLALQATTGRAHLQSGASTDAFGNLLVATSFGCVEGCAHADEELRTHALPALVADGAGWTWRTVRTFVDGAASGPRSDRSFEYDAWGDLLVTRGELSGTLALDRFHEVEGRAVAASPAGASRDGSIVTEARELDAFGNAVFLRSPSNGCRKIVYDADYEALPSAELIFVGAVGPNAGHPASRASAVFAATQAGDGCGSVALGSAAAFDRGLGLTTQVTGMHGETTRIDYDGFGRLLRLFKPDPARLGEVGSEPSLDITYDVDATGARPYARFRTRTQDGATPSDGSYRETWHVADGFGRTVVRLEQADVGAGDKGKWVVAGLTDYDAKGAPRRVFLPWFSDAAPEAFPLETPPGSLSTAHVQDAFGREWQTLDTTGQIAVERHFHALSDDTWDAADLRSPTHQGTYATTRRDGHGRVVATVDRERIAGVLQAYETQTEYLATGEIAALRRVKVGATPVVRTLRYDSLGRLVENVEPNTSRGGKAWRYAYDDGGMLVGTSDARGCGTNFHQDAAGRPLAEDYSPCKAEHAAYTAPDLATGDGTEVLLRYDLADPATPVALAVDEAVLRGQLVSASDRASQMFIRYDGRGRTTAVARRAGKPGPVPSSVAERYAATAYVQQISYDAADRVRLKSTGATVLLGAGGASAVTTTYSKRGEVKAVDSSYGALVLGVSHTADGLAEEIAYGDLARTRTTRGYDDKRRLRSVQTYRGPPPSWTPAHAGASRQLLLEDGEIVYDETDNPIELRDHRLADEWPDGAKPVTRKLSYDNLYRATRIDYVHAGGGDAWTSPFDAENRGISPDPRRAAPSPHVAFDARIKWQTFQYDWLGNTVATGDDARGFYDRSLGTVTNGAADAGPYQLRAASNATSTPGAPSRQGHLTARHDEAGHLDALALSREGPCLPAGAVCAQRFAYDWDEVGQLARARRWDLPRPGLPSDPLPPEPPSAELRYAYDGEGERVLKTALDATGVERHTVYVYEDLELRRATWTGDDYERTALTEVPYLLANGVRLARVAHAAEDVPSLASGRQRVFLELPDHLGSSSIVVDHETGELVERATYQGYGGADSDYRPERWASFREDHGFTGKEEDVEIGLQYFGARYYAPLLGRWASADPLAVHGLEADLNVYAYVHGRVVAATDPTGLQTESVVQAPVRAPGPVSTPVSLPPAAPNVRPSPWYAPGGFNEGGRLPPRAPSVPVQAPGVRPPVPVSAPGPGFGARLLQFSAAAVRVVAPVGAVVGVGLICMTEAPPSSGPPPALPFTPAEPLVLAPKGAERNFSAPEKVASQAQQPASTPAVEPGTPRDAAGRLRNADGTFAFDGGPKRATGGTHGNTAGSQEAVLYERYDANGDFLKHGISQDPATRYTKGELNGGFLIRAQQGPRSEMLKVERKLVETSPGPLNKEPWAGSRKP